MNNTQLLIRRDNLLNPFCVASCVPDCDSNEDARSRRSTRRELPFVSLGHDLNADLPIQRKQEGIDEEILIIDERSSGELGGKLLPLITLLLVHIVSINHLFI